MMSSRKISKLLVRRVLTIDYSAFLHKVSIVAPSLDILSQLEENISPLSLGTILLSTNKILASREWCEGDTTSTSMREFYVHLDSLIQYFDQSRTFYLYTLDNYETFLQYIACFRDHLFGKKAEMLRILIMMEENEPEEPDSTQELPYAQNAVLLFLSNLYQTLLQCVSKADEFYQRVQTFKNYLVAPRTVVTAVENGTLNNLSKIMSSQFHSVLQTWCNNVFQLVDLVESGNLTEQLQTVKSPYFQFPYITKTRLVDSGRLDILLYTYYSGKNKKIPTYSDKEDRLYLFSKKENIWEHSHSTFLPKIKKADKSAFLLYIERPEYSFLLNRNPPECFLVVVDHEDYHDIMVQGKHKMHIFLQGAVCVKKNLYALVG